MKIGLALSGGGFRATLYHLGVIRFLHDADLLRDVSHVCSVSGGSILAAHLTQNWKLYTGSDKQFQRAADCVIRFTRMDLRGRIVRRLPILLPTMLLPSGPRPYQLTRTTLFQRYLDSALYRGAHMSELPADAPSLHLLTTNMLNGGLCSFERRGFSIDFVPTRPGAPPDLHHTDQAPIAMAVAASAAFPAMFPPVSLTNERLGLLEKQLNPPEQFFTDGGVFDNLGFRKLQQLDQSEKFDLMLISEASASFDKLWISKTVGILRTLTRSADILTHRIAQLERERLEAAREREATVPAEQPGRYVELAIRDDLVDIDESQRLPIGMSREVAQLRTDMDSFSKLEIRSLIRHGFEVAHFRCGQMLGSEDGEFAPWNGFPAENAPVPTERDAKKLRPGADRRLRLFSLSDPISVMMLLALAGVLVGVLVGIYEAEIHGAFRGLMDWLATIE